MGHERSSVRAGDDQDVGVAGSPGITHDVPQVLLDAPGDQLGHDRPAAGHVDVDREHTGAQPTEERGHRCPATQCQGLLEGGRADTWHQGVVSREPAPGSREEQQRVDCSGCASSPGLTA